MADAGRVLAPALAPTVRLGGAIRRFHWAFLVGASFFLIVCLLLILTPWIAPYDPAAQNLLNRLAAPTPEHLFGTDHLGRDILSRILHGGRFSVSIAAIAVLITGISGTLIGAISARVGGLLDDFLMRVVDALLAFPEVLIALFLVFILGPGYGTLIVALAIAGWTPFARLTRAVTLEINTRGYIEAAEALGCSRTFIIFRHVLPNAIGPVLAQGFLRFGHQLITVGGLSYLGLGVQRPQSDWGAMLAEAQLYMIRAPWLVIFPGFAIFLTALSVTLAGHGLRQSLGRRAPRLLGAIPSKDREP
ncbi:MAG TPA: ABC transporter permease [Candidatus Limnocylindrales bacterium]|nr:ABC transporter permease [Candidatus Limnocylindrales bacterium]